MKLVFENPELKVIIIRSDVITSSGCTDIPIEDPDQIVIGQSIS